MPALWIIAEGTGRAWQVWPETEPLPAAAIQEGGQYLIELRNIADPLAADLFLDDLPVDALRPPGPDIARWRWSPGFHAGSLEVRLELGQGRRHRFPIITDPDLRKMVTGRSGPLTQPERLAARLAPSSRGAVRRGG